MEQHISKTYIQDIEKRLNILFNYDKYTCKPTTRDELSDIINKRIHKYGVDVQLNDIDTSLITNMSELFTFTNYSGDISRWNVSNVNNMSEMFCGCENFNCDLSSWNVSNVIDMHGMFYRCKNFNCDLSKWDVGKVNNMNCMFIYCENFNCDLSKWNIRNISNTNNYMFEGCDKFKYNIW